MAPFKCCESQRVKGIAACDKYGFYNKVQCSTLGRRPLTVRYFFIAYNKPFFADEKRKEQQWNYASGNNTWSKYKGSSPVKTVSI